MFARGVGYVGPEIKSVLPDDRTATATATDTYSCRWRGRCSDATMRKRNEFLKLSWAENCGGSGRSKEGRYRWGWAGGVAVCWQPFQNSNLTIK